MKVSELKEKLGLKQITQNIEDKDVLKGFVCDLLSWVMAKGEEGMAWVTVQNHLNVLAVACLHDFACVILPQGIAAPDETIKKAEEEDIAIFSSNLSAYEICVKMGELGVV